MGVLAPTRQLHTCLFDDCASVLKAPPSLHSAHPAASPQPPPLLLQLRLPRLVCRAPAAAAAVEGRRPQPVRHQRQRPLHQQGRSPGWSGSFMPATLLGSSRAVMGCAVGGADMGCRALGDWVSASLEGAARGCALPPCLLRQLAGVSARHTCVTRAVLAVAPQADNGLVVHRPYGPGGVARRGDEPAGDPAAVQLLVRKVRNKVRRTGACCIVSLRQRLSPPSAHSRRPCACAVALFSARGYCVCLAGPGTCQPLDRCGVAACFITAARCGRWTWCCRLQARSGRWSCTTTGQRACTMMQHEARPHQLAAAEAGTSPASEIPGRRSARCPQRAAQR